MPVLNRLLATRIVATPAALDALARPDENTLALRTAADELLLIPPVADVAVADAHAIITEDGGFAGVWLAAEAALEFLARSCEWELPHGRPAFAQGAVAGIPTKLWLEAERVLFVVQAPYAAEFEERMA